MSLLPADLIYVDVFGKNNHYLSVCFELCDKYHLLNFAINLCLGNYYKEFQFIRPIKHSQ